MEIDIVKTNDDNGAVLLKYQVTPESPTYKVTLPFVKNSEGLLQFNMTEETLHDLVAIFRRNLN